MEPPSETPIASSSTDVFEPAATETTSSDADSYQAAGRESDGRRLWDDHQIEASDRKIGRFSIPHVHGIPGA
jgi:hypothetical protein